ncbi:hypothetical protein ACIBEA_27590 [Streptomyces sp. NPDC051555]|uniref:hypothetical protein n=1 Tax=Streptomyces sp. NPDC051555 TaxID=3365657 RepID=UPI0037BE14E0
MRTRLLGFVAAVVLAVLGAAGPPAQAAAPAITGPQCVAGGGTLQYDSVAAGWVCVGGSQDTEPIT